MLRVRGILPQTFLVIVASFVLVAVEQADAAYISFYPPTSEWAPITVAVGGTIECTANESPYKSLKWFNNFDWKLVSKDSVLVVTEEMRHWKQPITLKCRAYTERDYPKIEGSYTFRVADASSKAVAEVPVKSIVSRAALNSVGDEDAEEYDDKYGDKYEKLEKMGGATSGPGVVPWISFYPTSSAEAPIKLMAGTGCVIECNAHGISSYGANYKWYDSNWNSVGWSNEVSVGKEMRHWKQPITLRCRVRNGDQEVEGLYTFQVANARPEAWVIAVAVTVPVVVLTIIAIAACFIIRCRKRKQKSTTKTEPYTGDSSAALLLQD